MQKEYIVELTDDKRSTLQEVVKKLKVSSQKVKRANILLKADVGGSRWTDARIAEALDCRTKTVENVRRRFVEVGFDEVLNGKKREISPTEKLLDGEQEAKIIALRLGTPRRSPHRRGTFLPARRRLRSHRSTRPKPRSIRPPGRSIWASSPRRKTRSA